jgi:hypothetical protein
MGRKHQSTGINRSRLRRQWPAVACAISTPKRVILGNLVVDRPVIDLALESARSSISVARTRLCQEGKVHEATCGPICLFRRSAILNYRKSMR